MLGSQISPNKTLSEQTSECTVCEIQINQYTIDCYPYAIRGVLFGILFGSVFWSSVIGALILVF